ncbi:MAG TPA: 4Fe-4S dicluster domain-containing protein [Anaeromyxobacter sp.]|nr:4Fe-4S dicluster domain-containing protein [Anaeromyxobacter sp.]
MAKQIRKVVRIDEERCDGCGDCVPSCAEGAIAIVDGKARLASDVLCDGLGACLGECPRGAISIEEREAEAFDEAAVARHLGRAPAPHGAPAAPAPAACPGSAPRTLPRRGLAVVSEPAGPAARAGARGAGALAHWPVQLRLVPVGAPFLAGADLLVAADCVPFAYPSFHAELLAGRAVVVGCPKLDDLPAYADKLTAILGRPDGPVRVTVARMEVPCCAGITAAAQHAAARAGRDVPVREVVVGVDGVVRG